MSFDWSSPLPFRCQSKHQETPQAVTLELAPLFAADRFDYKPGQFISLGIMHKDQWVYRAYSLSSLAHEPILRITVQAVDKGLVSNYLVHQLAVGETLQLMAPAGPFNCIDQAAKINDGTRQAVLVSAGCGITPVFAMAQYWLSQPEPCDVHFIHLAKSKTDTIYFDALQTMAKQQPNFHLHLLLKDAMTPSQAQQRFDGHWLQSLVPDFMQRSIYLCGPEQLMQQTAQSLEALNFEMAHFHHESFTPGPHASIGTTTSTAISTAAVTATAHDEAAPVQITAPAFGATMQANVGDNLADKLEEMQLPILAVCRSGVCGACKCKVTPGSVDSSSQETLSAQEIEDGYVLACSSTLKADTEVQLG
ncbi:NADH oxidoreductase HCR [Vibrio stylophorae]|uniref:NADH oxidoreductase HCR n=1 Tax=Vibrio stylophorae TaxID=659351 RepID=A0ABM8ZU30_9VIBR|nr:iron-sulfur cluster-binding domain-containing protein [Vibrio stylophorae]CAH0533821.1 NADH oxidoreductase HCR [Vibrio stylophorae]